MRIYHIEGASGAGKSSIAEELARRGYHSVDTDENVAYFGDPLTGLPCTDNKKRVWLWDKQKFENEIKKGTDTVYICGGAFNMAEYKKYFSKVFTLYADDKTLRQRLGTRANDEYGGNPKDLAVELEWNKGAEARSEASGSTLIDATRPLNMVVDEILGYTKDEVGRNISLGHVIIKKSGIGQFNDGLGVFACRDFKKGEIVIEYKLTNLTEEGYAELPTEEKHFTHKRKGVIYYYPDPERHVNRFEYPNVYPDFEQGADIALRDIKKGEELSIQEDVEEDF